MARKPEARGWTPAGRGFTVVSTSPAILRALYPDGVLERFVGAFEPDDTGGGTIHHHRHPPLRKDCLRARARSGEG